jgi:hypothetical protein
MNKTRIDLSMIFDVRLTQEYLRQHIRGREQRYLFGIFRSDSENKYISI